MFAVAAKYHNLSGWCRDLKAAIKAGEELAYEAAELVEDALDLVTPDGDDDMEDGNDGDVADEQRSAGTDVPQLRLPLGGSPGMGDPLQHPVRPPEAGARAEALAGADTGLTAMFGNRPITHGETERKRGRRGT